jgi:hypothetical protein
MEVVDQLAAITPGKEPTVPIGEEDGYAAERIWKLWGRKKYLDPTGNRTPAVQPVALRYTAKLSRIGVFNAETD